MKSTLIAAALLFSSPSFALNVSDFVGKYKATPVDVPIVTDTFEVHADGTITLSEEFTDAGKAYLVSLGADPATFVPVQCQGNATVSGNTVTSLVSCDNGGSYTQVIDLTGVDFTQATFQADVQTTANNASGVWLFERI